MIDERPELVEESLLAFTKELEILTDCPSLRRAQEECPDIVNNDEFRLMFLRTEVFDVKLAAKRFAKYWQDRESLWQDKAFQELTIDDNDQDVESLRFNYVGTVANNERLFYLGLGNLPKNRDVDSVCRVVLYTFLKALKTSQVLQRQGAIFAADFHNCRGYDKVFVERLVDVLKDSFPMRMSMFCLVRPLPLMGVCLNIIKYLFQPKLRNRVYVAGHDKAVQKRLSIDSTKDLLESVRFPAELKEATTQ